MLVGNAYIKTKWYILPENCLKSK